MADLLSAVTRDRALRAVTALRAAGQTVGTAESLTAGLCCAALTTVAGSSAVVRGGLVVYATELKASLAGVPAAVLDRFGPVSEPTARHLAVGASERTGSDWGVALTGVAGPDPQAGQPPGTVWVAVHGGAGSRSTGSRDGDGRGGDGTTCARLDCAGGRDAIRDQAVAGALEMLLARLGEQ